jgi:uncharacterized FlgJ-related protein
MNSLQRDFLDRASAEAVKASHPFPQMAACEAALESSWGNSQLAREGNNLFGMNQPTDERISRRQVDGLHLAVGRISGLGVLFR